MNKINLTITLTQSQIDMICSLYSNSPKATNQEGIVKRKRAIESFIQDSLDGLKSSSGS